MKLSYIVLGEYGEYDRDVFVCGVFATEQEAQDAIIAASERRRIYDTWSITVSNTFEILRQRNGLPAWYYQWPKELKPLWEKLHQEAKTMVGPEPPYESGARWSYCTMEIGKWYMRGADTPPAAPEAKE